jgi:hypothetical protein
MGTRRILPSSWILYGTCLVRHFQAGDVSSRFRQAFEHEQGLANRDYDLKHYDLTSGWLTWEYDVEKDLMIE